jgi:hypothetical protein
VGRATKKQVAKMRKQFVKPKKRKIEWDQFCVAHMKMVNNNGMFKECNAPYKPKDSCVGCKSNKRMKRYVDKKRHKILTK